MLVNIQLLRFLAALAVALYHYTELLPESGYWAAPLVRLIGALGFAGVDVFFVISGYIMTLTTLNQQGGIAAREFFGRRLARIYSGYWPFFLLALAVTAWVRPEHLAESELLLSFFLWPQNLQTTLLPLTWTLSYELYFYALFALGVWLLHPLWRGRLCLALAFTLLAFNLYRHFALQGFAADQFHQWGLASTFLSSPFLIEFFAGAALANVLSAPGSQRQGSGLIWLSMGMAVLLAAAWINVQGFGNELEQGYHVLPRVLLFGTAGLLLVAGLVRLEQSGHFASVRFSLLAGGASYAIYLAHLPLLRVAQKSGLGPWARQQDPDLALLAYLLLLTLVVLYCLWHYRRIERPLNLRFRQWISRWLQLG